MICEQRPEVDGDAGWQASRWRGFQPSGGNVPGVWQGGYYSWKPSVWGEWQAPERLSGPDHKGLRK